MEELSKRSQRGRQGGCETRVDKGFPSYCPSTVAGTAMGARFTIISPPWSSYCFQRTMDGAEFTVVLHNPI